MDERKPSFVEKLSKTVFLFIWFFIKKTNPNMARRLLYWGLTDQAFLTDIPKDPVLNIDTLGKHFSNPIGISAGFDTSLKYNDELIRIGFGFAEFGTFTYRRDNSPITTHFLPKHNAILADAPGFNNPGVQAIQKALIDRRRLPHIAGVSISSAIENDDQNNKEFYTVIEQDLLKAIQPIAPYCDFITLNLSHPNLPITNLAHAPYQLEILLKTLKENISKYAPIITPKLVVKLPLDIAESNISLLSEVFLTTGVDGVIISGFTASKSQKQKIGDSHLKGYLAGHPLMNTSTYLLRKFYAATKGQIPLIASGGVFTGEDAFEKIKAGASLVLVHSALFYKGPDIANEINKKLAFLLKKNGFSSLKDAVGSDFF